MKTLAAVLVLMSLLLFTGAAAVEDDVRNAEKGWAAAVAKRDEAALKQILSDDLIYAHSTGIIETKNEYLAKLRTGEQRYDGVEHSSMTVKIHGDAAIAHTKVRMHGATKGVPFDNQLMMMHVWAKQGGRWRLVAHQTTRLN